MDLAGFDILTPLLAVGVEPEQRIEPGAEPLGTAIMLAALGLLITLSVLLSRAVTRIGVPIVLLFLVLGMLGGSEGIVGLEFDNYGLAMRLGIVALVLILFDGGLNTPARTVRQVLAPASVLATVGVVLTAALVAVFGRWLGLSWAEAILLGAVVSSTDAAAVFAVLRGGSLHLRQRVERTIEVESCANDPMAVILTVTAIEWVARGYGLSPWLLLTIPGQLLIGGVVGALIGWLGRIMLSRFPLTTVGLMPALTISIAFVSFGAATIVQGSGFLAVYVTAVVLGNQRALPYRTGLVRVHDALAWLSQIGMFLMLGLLVLPSELLSVLWVGLAIGLFLGVIARPLAVAACLWPFRFEPRETLFIGWTGLRGAVPIILATMPVLAGVDEEGRLFHIVFFVVVVTSIVPGATLRMATRLAGLVVPEKPVPNAVLEIHSARTLQGELASFFVDESLAVSGARLKELDFPAGSAVVLIVRGQQLMAARGSTVLRPGDHVYIFCAPEDRGLIELLFGRPEDE